MRRRDHLWAEQRAAAIATDMFNSTCNMSLVELGGWMRAGDKRERGSQNKSRQWHAGWLAAHIWYENKYGKEVRS